MRSSMVSAGRAGRCSSAFAVAAALLALLFTGAAARAQQAPGTPAPTPAAGASSDPIAGPVRKSDTIRVVVAGADSLGGEFRVDADGTVALPRLGQVPVVGKMQGAVAQDIARRIETEKLLKRADVAVYIVGRKAREVVINGAVTTQGRQTIKDGAVLSEALEAAVPAAGADLSRVVLSRGGKDTTVNFQKFRTGESNARENNPLLEDDDRIYVYAGTPSAGTVRVTGEVKDAAKGQVPISRGMTVGQVLQSVGGVTEYADRNGIVVVRNGQSIPVSYDDILKNVAGKDIPLQDKDELRIPRLEKPKEFTVAGAVRASGQFPLLTKVTLLEAVARAGGPQEGAQQNKVELRRRDPSGSVNTRTYDLKNDKEAATEIAEGDYVFVPYPRRRPGLDAGTIIGILSGTAVLIGTLRR